MKKLFLLILCFNGLFTSILWSQNSVNVDNLKFTYWERALPKKNFNPQFFYYTSQFVLPQTIAQFISEKELADQFRITQQRKAEVEDDADMLVNIVMQPIEIIDFSIEKKIEEKKTKQGDIIRTKTYWLAISYSFAANAEAINPKNNVVIARYEMQNRKQHKIFKSRAYDNRKAAELYWVNNQDLLREEFTRAEALVSIERLNSMIDNDYSCLVSRKTGLIKTINEKKHPENETLRKMSNSLASKLKTLDENRSLQLEDVVDELSYFMEIPQRYPDLKLKADIRLRYVAYYNICRTYLLLEQPEKVQKWANLLYENGHDKKDRERLTTEATNLQRTLVTGIGTLHFNPQDYFND